MMSETMTETETVTMYATTDCYFYNDEGNDYNDDDTIQLISFENIM